MKVDAIIVQAHGPRENALYAAGALNIGVLELQPNHKICGLFSLNVVTKPKISSKDSQSLRVAKTVPGFVTFDHPETVLLLHTSGTSGTKKLVPYSLDMLIVGVGCITASWNLKPTDVCINMMPLFHIGGIVRNVFSPILSGGSVITCGGFDPVLFWDVLSTQRVTSYYAAPTMHHAILMEAERRPKPLPVSTMRYIANAAGGLLPVLADKLKLTFPKAVILTSYGMTECMPIASPPQTYAMEPIGTSGTIVGPDVMIANDEQHRLGVGQSGNIMIRGPPCFGGYENNLAATDESFWSVDGEEGWFNTGDVGYLDDQGYLFISGRSKEIINRGGETISPFEIEEAVVQHPWIKETLAFSAPHEEYQETVGAVIVSKLGYGRVDLPTLHKYLEDKLHRSKWPQILVYMDGLPKNTAGKILRIKLGERFRLSNVNEESNPISRLYEGMCPPIGTSLSTSIDIKRVQYDLASVVQFIMNLHREVTSVAIVMMDLPVNKGCFVAVLTPATVDAESIKNTCNFQLHSYLAPSFILCINSFPFTNSKIMKQPFIRKSLGGIVEDPKKGIDDDMLRKLILDAFSKANVVKPRDALESAVELVWREHLFGIKGSRSGKHGVISVHDSFFDLGGDSLKAGQLINAMRKALSVKGLSVPDLFASPTIALMSKKVSTLGYSLAHDRLEPTASIDTFQSPERNKMLNNFVKHSDNTRYGGLFSTPDIQASSSSFACMLIMAIPFAIIFPIRRMSAWFFVAQPWVIFMQMGIGRLRALLLAMIVARIMIGTLSPLIAILCKWLIIGRYKPGRYPLWGSMYLRWWIVEQIIRIMGKGYLSGDIPIVGPHVQRLYLRLMGIKIGRNVKIGRGTSISQFDLVTIEDGVVLDDCLIRPFGLEKNHFILLPIIIGKRSSVGAKSTLAPGAVIPPDTHIGPLSSSHELEDSNYKNMEYCRPLLPGPPWYLMIFIGAPILLVVALISYMPWYLLILDMEENARKNGWYMDDINNIVDAFSWWVTPKRLPYYFLLRILRRTVVPPIKLASVIFVKKFFIGKFKQMDKERMNKPWNRFKYWLMANLMDGNDLCGVAYLVGRHYEIISTVYRLLGAKVGKRVYWPGSGFDIVEYDLLEIGDDVVFGSRSIIMTRSTEGSVKVVIADNAMLADRCVVLPGVVQEQGSVIGTGGLGKEGYTYPIGSVWVGSQSGNAVNVLSEDISIKGCKWHSAFGTAFYDRQANFYVFPLWMVVAYNSSWQVFCSCYHNVPPVLAIYASMYVGNVDSSSWMIEVFKIVVIYCIPVYACVNILSLVVDIAAKWLILGRRQKGTYPWDKSSYCQRWQMYLTIQEIRRGEGGETGVLDLIQGSEYLNMYFRALGGKVGRDVCLYPNGGDPMMTEPDLVTIGDNAAVDNASLIAHINTRGVFSLNPLNVGMGSVLKSNSRLLSGASMDDHSILLEHTLILAGDCVDTQTVWQGWPSKVSKSLKQHQDDLVRLFAGHRIINRIRLRDSRSTFYSIDCGRDYIDSYDSNDDYNYNKYSSGHGKETPPPPTRRRNRGMENDREANELSPLLS